MTDQPSPADARQQLYEIVREDVPFDEKARAALELGTRVLGVDNAHLSRVHEETNHWKAMVTTDTDDGLTPPELELDLRETYCRHAVDSRDQLALSDAAEEGYEDDPALDARGLSCYLGTPLVLDGEPRGMVCFVSAGPREEPFSDAETRFAEFLTRLLERELARDRVETELTNQSNLAAVLNRVLRHNLRNEMSVIRGFAQLMAEDSGEDYSETVLTHIDDLMALSEKARELERIITIDAERTVTDVVALVEAVAEAVAADYPNATITVEGDEVTTAILPTLERAIEELLENAAKHAGEAPTATVTVETVAEAVEVRISDDGPGLSKQEIEVLTCGEETPFTHGSGLGLWLARWIVTSHSGEIDATATADGTVMTVSIPRRPAVTVSRQPADVTRSRDQYHAAFTEAHDAMVVVNDDARILDANPAAGELFGLDAQALHGRGLPEFLPGECEIGETWETIQTPGTDRETVRLTAADGIDRIVEYAATTDIVPGQHLFVARDVTERVAREAELSRKTQAMDAAPIGIILTDPTDADNPIVYANEAFCELTGYAEREIIGRNCRFLQGEATKSERVERMGEAIENGEPVTVTLRNYRADGTPFWNHVTIAPVEAGDEELMVGFQEDVTDRIDRPLSPVEPSNRSE
ncbi:PAS domain S-box protein [Halonotius terrestris]|uniref:PAS domain S-box protein n=1 Tax=Halonotius terrestris TaxID=2487750 RepID=A0A8J8TC96_9EURY|nr:PAS domain-containing protein [Halonotius terrestris]TQQ80963.1 PAS domain S-box protein [Halonotius terrestris]